MTLVRDKKKVHNTYKSVFPGHHGTIVPIKQHPVNFPMRRMQGSFLRQEEENRLPDSTNHHRRQILMRYHKANEPVGLQLLLRGILEL